MKHYLRSGPVLAVLLKSETKIEPDLGVRSTVIKNAIDTIEAYQLYISYCPLFARILFQWSMVAPNNFCIKPVGGGSKILHYFFKIKKSMLRF